MANVELAKDTLVKGGQDRPVPSVGHNNNTAVVSADTAAKSTKSTEQLEEVARMADIFDAKLAAANMRVSVLEKDLEKVMAEKTACDNRIAELERENAQQKSDLENAYTVYTNSTLRYEGDTAAMALQQDESEKAVTGLKVELSGLRAAYDKLKRVIQSSNSELGGVCPTLKGSNELSGVTTSTPKQMRLKASVVYDSVNPADVVHEIIDSSLSEAADVTTLSSTSLNGPDITFTDVIFPPSGVRPLVVYGTAASGSTSYQVADVTVPLRGMLGRNEHWVRFSSKEQMPMEYRVCVRRWVEVNVAGSVCYVAIRE